MKGSCPLQMFSAENGQHVFERIVRSRDVRNICVHNLVFFDSVKYKSRCLKHKLNDRCTRQPIRNASPSS